MTVYKDNPAGRMYDLLHAFREAGGKQYRFAQILKISASDGASLLQRFGQVFSLPDDIEAAILQVDKDDYDPDLALRWQDSLVEIIGNTLFWGEENPTGSAFSEFMSSLEYCSYVLHRHRPYQMPSESDLDHLKSLTSELLGQLKDDPNIDDDLRTFLLIHTEAMDRALNDVAIRGVTSLEEEFDRAVGALNRRADLTVRSDAHPSVWKKFGDLLIAVAAVLQISTSAFMLPGQVRQAIEGPQPTQVEVVQQKPQAATGSAVSERPGDTGGQSVKKPARERTSHTP